MRAPVVELDARLLAAGATAIDAALDEHRGAPALLIARGVDHLTDETAATLRQLPFLVAASAPVAARAAAAVDLILEEPTHLDAVIAGYARAPTAATAAALLLRGAPSDGWDGLVRESTTYSMLQAGDEFRRWQAARGPAPAVRDAEPRLRVTRHGGVTELTLSRPARHNALDVRMRDELYVALGEAITRPDPIVLFGDGPSFCSGGDLDEFGTFNDPASAHLVRLGRSVAALVAAASARIVVGLHGACLGAGLELPAFARHVVAADDTRLGLPELSLGLVPGSGGTVSLPPRVGRHRTLALLLHDGTISAPAALGWGLVDEVVPHTRLRARCLEIAESLR